MYTQYSLSLLRSHLGAQTEVVTGSFWDKAQAVTVDGRKKGPSAVYRPMLVWSAAPVSRPTALETERLTLTPQVPTI